MECSITANLLIGVTLYRLYNKLNKQNEQQTIRPMSGGGD